VFGYGLDDRAIEVRSPAEAKNFPLTIVSRPALGPTEPPVEWVLSTGLKGGRGVTLTTHPQCSAEVENGKERYLLSPKRLCGQGGTALALVCVQTSSEAHPASYSMGIGGPSSGVKRGRRVTLNALSQLLPRSRMCRSYTFSLGACMAVARQPFMCICGLLSVTRCNL
jgi:hypothetical protein